MSNKIAFGVRVMNEVATHFKKICNEFNVEILEERPDTDVPLFIFFHILCLPENLWTLGYETGMKQTEIIYKVAPILIDINGDAGL